jgi:hypothetical protein
MKKKLVVALVSMLVLVTVFTTTSPASAPAFLLIVPFAAIFSLLSVGVLYVCQRRGWSRARSFRGALVGAGVPVVILVLQSIGQLTPRDMVTIGAIFLVLYFYLSRLSFAK